MTNGDYIRKMSDEELMAWKRHSICPDEETADNCYSVSGVPLCNACWIMWLKKERKEEEK